MKKIVWILLVSTLWFSACGDNCLSKSEAQKMIVVELMSNGTGILKKETYRIPKVMEYSLPDSVPPFSLWVKRGLITSKKIGSQTQWVGGKHEMAIYQIDFTEKGKQYLVPEEQWSSDDRYYMSLKYDRWYGHVKEGEPVCIGVVNCGDISFGEITEIICSKELERATAQWYWKIDATPFAQHTDNRLPKDEISYFKRAGKGWEYDK